MSSQLVFAIAQGQLLHPVHSFELGVHYVQRLLISKAFESSKAFRFLAAFQISCNRSHCVVEISILW